MELPLDILQKLLFLFLGLLGIFIIAFDLREKRKLYKEDIDIKRAILEEDKKERESRLKILKRETFHLAGVSELIADRISKQLKEDTNWAAEALEEAKLKPRAQTLFTERLRHFHEEKEFLAEKFVELLLERCKCYAKSGKKVYLLIDSGTTLYPFFDKLGKETVRYFENKEEWIDNLILITNSIAGVEKLIEVGRIDPNNRYSHLAIKCKLLPGTPLPIYSAVTGIETNKALENFKKEASDNDVFIGLTTGNWVRLRRSDPICPVPLARGDCHYEFKEAMFKNSDEIYVISPLGKIFIGVSKETVINEALDFSDTYSDPDKQPYKEVYIDGEKAKVVKLVSTFRVQGRLLHDLSTRLSEKLGVDLNDRKLKEKFISEKSENIPHVLFPFDKLPENLHLQIDIEFPHPHTHDEEFMRKFFFIPDNT